MAKEDTKKVLGLLMHQKYWNFTAIFDVGTRAQLSWRKSVMPNAFWYTDIFGLDVYNRVQKLSSCASVDAWCDYVKDRCRQIGVHAVAGISPTTIESICCSVALSA